jgi:phosphate transport system substrate-binding protein
VNRQREARSHVESASVRKKGRRRVAIIGAAIVGILIAAWLFFGIDSPHPKDSPPVQVEKRPIAEAPVQQDQPKAVGASNAEIDIASRSKTVSTIAPPKPFYVGTSVSVAPLIKDATRYLNNYSNANPPFPETTVAIMSSTAMFGTLCADTKPLDAAVVDRRILPDEFAVCRRSQKHITEIKLGYEAIALVRSRLYGAPTLSAKALFLALAREVPDPVHPAILIPNPNGSWAQVDSGLPDERINVLGPPISAAVGTTFRDLIMKAGCLTVPTIAVLKESDPDRFEVVCKSVRDDGAYQVKGVFADGNPFNFVGYLQANPEAIALLGFRDLSLIFDSVSVGSINGVAPSRANIYSGSYPGARTLYLYANTAVPRMRDFVFAIWTSVGGASGDAALITLDASEQQSLRQEVSRLPDLKY